MSAHDLMSIVGVIEIYVALLVLFRAREGAYVVAAWLAVVMINLMAIGGYLDIVLRDLALCLGALALARLSPEHEATAAT